MSAIISDCGKYRYRLDREVQDEGLVYLFCGVNPSTADADVDDATVRKWVGFTKRNNGKKFIAVNPFAYRATDVNELKLVDDPYGPDIRKHLHQAIAEADVLVPCWGNTSKVPQQLRAAFKRMFKVMHESGKPIKTFGYTLSGDPKHPLMLGYDTKLINYIHKEAIDVWRLF